MVNGFRAAMMSLAEVSQQLHVNISTVYRWAGSGVRGRRLPSMLIGGRRYCKIADLEIFLQATPSADTSVSDDHRNQAAQQQLASFGIVARSDRSDKA